MKFVKLLMGLLGLLFFTAPLMAQTLLTGPESVSYDHINNQYLVSNYYTGIIVAIDPDGNESTWAQTGGIASGTCIKDDIFYVDFGNGVKGFSLIDASLVWTAPLPASGCDGIAIDSSGYMYAIRPSTSDIYKIDMAAKTYTVLSTAITSSYYAQDVVYDVANDRLLVCCYASGTPIYSVNPHTGDITPVITPEFTKFDGIIMDPDGGVYLSCHEPTAVIRYNNSFTGDPILIWTNGSQPSGLEYNIYDDVIAIPDFNQRKLNLVDVSAPRPVIKSKTISYRSGAASPQVGDTIDVLLTLENQAHAISDVSVQIQTDDPYVEILNPSLTFASTMDWGDVVTGPEPFGIRVDESCPDPHYITLEIDILGTEGSATDTLILYYGTEKGFNYNFDPDASYWSHHPYDGVRLDQWHLESADSHSGDNSFKCGGDGTGRYGSYNAAFLVSPPVFLAANSQLTFWHRISGYLPSATNAWAGGTVWMETQDGTVSQLFPVGGYPASFSDFTMLTLDPNTECYGGETDWAQATFDLTAYEGSIIRIIFRFDTRTAFGYMEGWYIDDVSVVGDPEFICGDANGDESVNIVDASFLVNYIFFGGATPDPVESGDANNDGSTNIVDASYIVNYIFFGGSGPCES